MAISMKKIFSTLLIASISFTNVIASQSTQEPKSSQMSAETGGIYPTYPKVDYGTGEKAKHIHRGEYLVKMGDCIACHTDVKGHGKTFAGNYPIDTPFGIIYTPNITSDKRTGIGAWTDEQFIKAVREGVSPNYKFNLPALPFLWYNRVSDQDLKDIKAYLDATPPVYTPTRRKNTIPFPLNQRFLQLGWRMMFFYGHRGRFKPDPNRSKQWNRGAYIVQGLGHCGMCHTPANFVGAPKRQYHLTGSMISGYYAPNITSTNFKNTPIEDIYNVFMKDELVGGGKVEFGMLEDNHDSLSYLKREDLEAIAVYLKSVKSKQPPVHQHVKASNEDAAGAAIYNQYCFACHKMGSGGAPKLGNAADWAPLIDKGMNVLYKNAINGINGMPAKGTCMSCTNTQIQQAVQFMVHQVKGKSASAVSAPKPINMTQAKKLYEVHCAMCHQKGAEGAPITGDKDAWHAIANKGFNHLFYEMINPQTGVFEHGICPSCTHGEVIAMLKYMLNQSTDKNYKLW